MSSERRGTCSECGRRRLVTTYDEGDNRHVVFTDLCREHKPEWAIDSDEVRRA